MGCWGGLIVEVLFVATGGGVVVKGGVWCGQSSIGKWACAILIDLCDYWRLGAQSSLMLANLGAWVRSLWASLFGS